MMLTIIIIVILNVPFCPILCVARQNPRYIARGPRLPVATDWSLPPRTFTAVDAHDMEVEVQSPVTIKEKISEQKLQPSTINCTEALKFVSFCFVIFSG